MTAAVSIVIPTWNGLELLKRFLPSVIGSARHYHQRSQSPTEIIVVDDGSRDQTIEWLRAEGFVDHRSGAAASGFDLKFVSSEMNQGFGEACNLGFASASHPLVFLINNDAEPALDGIRPLVANFEEEMVFAAHCRVFDLDTRNECGTGKIGSFARGFIRVHKSYIPVATSFNHRDALYSMFAGGGAAMFDRKKFLDIGGFESLLSPFYWEDVELSYRAWKRGYTILYEPRSVVYHRFSSTIGKLNQRTVRKIDQRNRIVYHWIDLHDGPMLASHAMWVLLLAISAPLRLKPEFVSSCFGALKLLPRILKRRREEKRLARRGDRELFGLFADVERRKDLFAFDRRYDL